MRTRIILILSLVAACAPNTSVGQIGRETSLWKWTARAEHHEAIVMVSADGALATGIVFNVDRVKPIAKGFQGHCLTAYHVVERDNGRREIKVTYRDGSVSARCKVLQFNRQFDVAVIWVWVPADLEPAKLAGAGARSGDYLEFAGLGGGSRIDCCLRHFSSVAAAPTNKDKIFADLSLLPGDSGGPVFNHRQEVVGVISGGWFWWDGGIKTENNSVIRATWPAVACNVETIHRLIAGIQPRAKLNG